MAVAKISIKKGKRVIATLRFTYSDNLFSGRLSIVGSSAKEIRRALSEPMGLYVPDAGEAAAGKKPQTGKWPWLLAAARYITTGKNALGTSFEVVDPPPQNLLPEYKLLPFNVLP